MFVDNLIILHVPIQITCTLGEEDVEILEIRNNRSGQVRSNPQGWKNLRDKSLCNTGFWRITRKGDIEPGSQIPSREFLPHKAD